jgi:hypothetical protein
MAGVCEDRAADSKSIPIEALQREENASYAPVDSSRQNLNLSLCES